MSNFNGKGPDNGGPMSGKGKGYCIKEITDNKEKESFCKSNNNSGCQRRQRRNCCQNISK